MKYLLTILIFISCNQSEPKVTTRSTTASTTGRTFYISESGNDGGSGTINSPWRTINKLNSYFGSLQAGDVVLFRRGETFYGTITVNKSGTSGNPIVISDYGEGAKPVITSLVTLSGWNNAGNGVYESASNSSFDAAVNVVLLNGVIKGIGRYPNDTYLYLESHVSNTSITDNQLPSSPNWTGADVIIRTSRWTLDKGKITNHSGTRITYTPTPNTYTPVNNYGYFIQNNIKTLDQLGEWYYNPSTKRIYMYFGSNNPSSYNVQAASSDNLVYSSNRSYVGFENIEFKGANGNNINIVGGVNNFMTNCDVDFSGKDGLNVTGSYFKLENSTVINSLNNGVHVGNCYASQVRNNLIKNNYFIAGMGGSGNGQGAGVRNSTNGLVEYNQIINSGYIGVQLGGNNAIVKNNLIDSFCFVKDDGAAVYTSNGENNTYTGRKIIGNIILNAIGAPAGTPSTAYSAEGIYMDDNVNGVEISGNTIANCNRGIFLHNTKSIGVKDNTVFSNINGQLFMKHDALGVALRDHIITNNIFFAKQLTQNVASFITKDNDIAHIGDLDNNYYVRPINDRVTFYSTIYYLASAQVVNYMDLEAWKSKYPHDEGSNISSKSISPYKLIGLIGSSKFANSSFNSNVSGVFANKCAVSWSNSNMDGGHLKVVPSGEGSTIVMSIGGLTSGKRYILRYSAKSTATMSIAANLRAANYIPNTLLMRRTISPNRSENEILFQPFTNESSAALVFTAAERATYYLDNIQLYEANATVTDVEDSIRFEYNASTNTKLITLDGKYTDVKNNIYDQGITLQPYSSAVLIKVGAGIINPPIEYESGILESENAVLYNAVVASNHAGFTGTGFADYINTTGDFVEFTLNKKNTGSASLSFRYANGGSANRPLRLEINGMIKADGLAFPPTGGWAKWSTTILPANLNAGDNKIRLTAIGSSAGNIDHLAWEDLKP